MMRKFYYYTEGPALYGDSLETARWGISAEISTKFADKLAKEKRTERVEEILERDAKMLMAKGKFPYFKRFEKQRIHHFFEDTCLVRTLQVPGNACDLAVDESALRELERFREKRIIEQNMGYMQHNVDSFMQAVFLEILFRNWANHFEYLFLPKH